MKDTDRATEWGQAMLKVVEEVYSGGKTFIPNWSLLSHAQESLRRGGPSGLKSYYRRCIKSRKSAARRVRDTLESHDRKTLESEYPRFLAIYHSYYPIPVKAIGIVVANNVDREDVRVDDGRRGPRKKTALLAIALALAGCSTYAAPRYSIAPTNVAVLRAFRGQAVSVGPFTAAKPGRSEITCRAVGPIKTPDGEPFEEFIRKAFMADLGIAEVYSAAAPVTLTGRLDALDFSSGLTDAAWDIAITISSPNGRTLSIDNHYAFSGNFAGDVACNQTAQALMPAVQDLIGKIVGHPDFADLLR